MKNLQAEIERLQDRRAELAGELEALQVTISRKIETLGGDLLVGRDISKNEAELLKSQNRARALEVAINQADRQLDELAAQDKNDRRAAAIDQAGKLDQEGIGYLVDLYAAYQEAEAAAQAFDQVRGQAIDALTGIDNPPALEINRLESLARAYQNERQILIKRFAESCPDLAERA